MCGKTYGTFENLHKIMCTCYCVPPTLYSSGRECLCSNLYLYE